MDKETYTKESSDLDKELEEQKRLLKEDILLKRLRKEVKEKRKQVRKLRRKRIFGG